jgi:hypothetical protein
MGRPAIPEASRIRLDETVKRLGALLPAGWEVSVEARRDGGGDIELRADGEPVAELEVVARKRLDPRSFDRLTLPDPPVIVYADWLSPRTRELIRGRGASYVDGTGNVDVSLAKPPVVIRTDGAQRDPNPPPSTGPTLRGPRAWALMRTLIEVRPPYTAGELSARLDVDDGYVSRVLQALVDQRLIERAPRRQVTDVDWEPLLRQLVLTYSLFGSNETSTWVASSGPETFITDVVSGGPKGWAVSGSFAASSLVSVTAGETAVMYHQDPERFARLTRLLPTRTGANVVLARPYDPIVFERIRDDAGLRRVSIAQAALDLLTGPARMPAEGEALLTWMRRNESRWRSPSLRG